MFLHGFKHSRLGFGRGPVDFVGQTDLGKDRSLLELEGSLSLGSFHDHVGAQNVGRHQIGGKLDTREVEVERLCQGAHEQRLAEPGYAFKQTVPADE